MKELNNQGHTIGIYRVRRLMRELGLKAKAARRYKVTTDSRHSFPVAANLLNRQFNVDQPDRYWTADITYVWTLEGWMYLAIVMDLFSRRIVGWAMDKGMKAQLSIDALAMAYWIRKPAKGLVHHSDYIFTNRKAAQLEVIDYIGYYNGIRLHSTLGYQSPLVYEKELYRNAA